MPNLERQLRIETSPHLIQFHILGATINMKIMLNLARILIVGISLLFCLITTTFSQTKADRIEELMTTYAELGKFNGSILVAADGQVIYKGGFGLANMEWDIAN